MNMFIRMKHQGKEYTIWIWENCAEYIKTCKITNDY